MVGWSNSRDLRPMTAAPVESAIIFKILEIEHTFGTHRLIFEQ